MAGVPQLDHMARALGVDWGDLAAAMFSAAKQIKAETDLLEMNKATMGLVAYGVAVGYFYAKQENRIVQPDLPLKN